MVITTTTEFNTTYLWIIFITGFVLVLLYSSDKFKKTKKTIDDILAIGLTILMLIGFSKLGLPYMEDKNKLTEVLTLFTLPWIIGGLLLATNEYKKNGKIFLFSGTALYMGYFLFFSIEELLVKYISVGLLSMGIIGFGGGLVKLFQELNK